MATYSTYLFIYIFINVFFCSILMFMNTTFFLPQTTPHSTAEFWWEIQENFKILIKKMVNKIQANHVSEDCRWPSACCLSPINSGWESAVARTSSDMPCNPHLVCLFWRVRTTQTWDRPGDFPSGLSTCCPLPFYMKPSEGIQKG